MKNLRRWPWLILIVTVVALDAWSKWQVLQSVGWGGSVELTSFFNLHVAFNRGMAFGILQGYSGWQVIFLTVVALSVSCILLVWMFVSKGVTRFFLAGLALIAAGALGNSLDRLVHGSVTDFLDFYLYGWHFWTFNVADVAITVGVICLLIDWLFYSDQSGSSKSN